jgi:hypothetical protein
MGIPIPVMITSQHSSSSFMVPMSNPPCLGIRPTPPGREAVSAMDREAWGFQKNTYLFKDLENLFKCTRGKKKGKESSGKGSGKTVEKSSGKKKKGGWATS